MTNKLTKKFGPTAVTETSISRIQNGELEIAGLSIGKIVETLSYKDLAKKLWIHKGADASLFWVKPPELPLNKVFSLYKEDISVLQILRTVVALVPETKNYWQDAANLLTSMVSCVAAFGNKKEEVKAKEIDSLSAFFLEAIGKKASGAEIKAFDSVMLIHAENEVNLSTLGLRLAASTGASFREAIVAAMGILSGPLHGGASSEVMTMLEEIKDSKNIEAWLERALSEKRKIMGFGHLLYKDGDPRALLLKNIARDLAVHQKNNYWMELSENLEKAVFSKKALKPNLDFYSAVIYEMLQIPKELALGIFAMSRMLGWALHYEEQKRVKVIITPTANFIG